MQSCSKLGEGVGTWYVMDSTPPTDACSSRPVPHRVPRLARLDYPGLHPRVTLRDGRPAILDTR